VTSTSLTGSQNPTGTPGTIGKGGLGQKQGIVVGLWVSSRPLLLMFTGPIVIGNKHDQQISVIGLTKRPEHVAALALVIVSNLHAAIDVIIREPLFQLILS